MAKSKTTSSLMAEADGDEVPSLGGSTLLESTAGEPQSFLGRLIEQSTSEQRGDAFAGSFLWDDTGNGTIALQRPTEKRRFASSPEQKDPPLSPAIAVAPNNVSLVTLAACTCCLLRVGLLWSSFLSSSWLDTRLFLDVSIPSVHIKTDEGELLHSTTLGSLLGDLIGADQHWAAIALVLTSLVLPCLCIICEATWIVEDRKKQTKRMQAAVDAANSNNASRIQRRSQRSNHRCHSWLSPRAMMEYIARVGLSIVFVVCILDIGTSPLAITFEDSGFIVANQIRGGLAAYAFGWICDLFVLALLRLGKVNAEEFCESTYAECHDGNLQRDRDFECSWETSEVHSNELFAGSRSRTRTTEQNHANHNELVEMEAPLLQNEWWNDNPTSTDSPTERISVQTKRFPFWKRAVLYELALLSTLLWLPALSLPLFRLEYGGIASDFMSEFSLSFRLKDIPAEIWERGTSAGTSRLVLSVIEKNFVLLVFVCPMLANVAAIGAWVCDLPFRTRCRQFLWMLQPCLGTVVFGVAVFVSVPAFETVTEVAIHKFASVICDKFELVTSDTCFTIQGGPSIGLWFLLGEALALELLVIVTLSWETE